MRFVGLQWEAHLDDNCSGVVEEKDIVVNPFNEFGAINDFTPFLTILTSEPRSNIFATTVLMSISV